MSLTEQVVQQERASEQQEANLESCPECKKSFRHKEYLDHLFGNKDCMRAYWREEERTHAYRVRQRSLSRRRPVQVY
jgi:hypothetical protein